MPLTPNPWSAYYTAPVKPAHAASAAPARPRLPNGLFVWDPARDESGYWAQPLPITPAQAEHNRAELARPLRKDVS